MAALSLDGDRPQGSAIVLRDLVQETSEKLTAQNATAGSCVDYSLNI